MRRGRPPEGSRLVERHDGSAYAKKRLQVIMETNAGKHTITEACDILGIGKTAFHELRAESIDGSLSRLEPAPQGRPKHVDPEDTSRVRALQKEVQELKIDLRAAQIREEIALAMPHLLERKAKKKAKTPKGPKRRNRKT